ncbi:MFS transporter [Niveispirillum sp. KHB5.9]|uniref:MFS transporter n=1 Tax=Niveispirillum sp. KHB5.9 TaxID=3400269 RepID=UPI003A8C168B
MTLSPSPHATPRLFIAGLGIAQIIAWGSLLYAFPLLAVPMAAELGWTKMQAYLLASLALGSAGLAAYPVGRAIDRGQGRLVLAGGAGLGALSLVLWGLSGSLWTLVPAFIGIGVAQAMTLYEPAFAVIARRFGTGTRDAITGLTLWGGFASTVFIPVTQLLLDHLGWRGTTLALAGFNLLLALPLLLWLLRGEVPTAATAEAAASDRAVASWALRQWSFWGLALSFMLYFAAFTGVTFHLYPLLAERGVATADIVIIMAIVGPAQVAGRVLVMGLARGASIALVGSLTTLTLALSLLGLAMAGTGMAALAGFALVYGAANGILTIVRGAAVPEMLTRRAYGAINGLLTTPIGIVRALAPFLAALIHEATGGYGGVLAAFIIMAALMTLVFWLVAIRPKPTVEGQ